MGKKITEFLRLNIFKGDKGLWMIYFLLCMVSLVTIYSASSRTTFKSEAHWAPLVEQICFLFAGFLCMVVISKIPCKFFKLIPMVGLPLAAGMLLFMLVMQRGVNDAARWMHIFGVSFQPSEFAKSMLIMAVAVVLSKTQKNETVKTSKGVKHMIRATKGGHARPFKIVGCLALIICALILPENFSTAVMLFVVVVIMMFIGNVPLDLMWKGLLTLAVVGIVFVSILLIVPENKLSFMKRAVTWKHRIESVIGTYQEDEKSQEYKDKTLQVKMSQAAIAASGVSGVGIGNSTTRDFLPHAESDFIYSIVVEETGIFGAVFVLLLYVMLLVRVGRVAQKCDRFFPAFLIVGLGIMMVVQALVNMAVASGLSPVTGQTLPLISKGGTSILITSFNLGMIMSVSRYANKVEEKNERARLRAAREYETEEIYSSEGMD